MIRRTLKSQVTISACYYYQTLETLIIYIGLKGMGEAFHHTSYFEL